MSDVVMPADTLAKPQRASVREILAWCMYDVADSPFTTIMVTAMFPLYFKRFLVDNPETGDLLWGFATGGSQVIVALLLPVCGAIADFRATRKRWLGLCAVLLVLFCMSLSLVPAGMGLLGLGLFIVANVAFGGGGVFIDSFLPSISTPQNAGRISGLKWAMGYIAGLVVLGICLPLSYHLKPDWNADDLFWARLIPLVVAGWYAVTVIPTFLWLRERGTATPLPPGEGYVGVGFRRLRDTFRNMRRYRELFKLFIAFLIYNEGVVTVITFAALYAEETVKMTGAEITLLLLAINIVAAAGGIGFGFLADRVGQKRTIMASLVIWLAAVLLAAAVPTRGAFYVVAVLAGIGIGSSQSVTRSLVSLFTPPEKAAEFFGLLGVAGKALALVAPALFGVVSYSHGQRWAMLVPAVSFGVGMILLSFVNEERGKAAAREPVA